MNTGDNTITSRVVAEECGIIAKGDERDGVLMEGTYFRNTVGDIVNKSGRGSSDGFGYGLKNKDNFSRVASSLAVLARATPEAKYTYIVGLREQGRVVAVTGDGTNDAPALSIANVGFSLGISGTDIAKSASSIILLDDNFSSIVKGIRWGRNLLECISKVA